MPRLDRTFSDLDVLRIIDKHLDRFERARVLAALLAQGDTLTVAQELLDAIAGMIAPFDGLISFLAKIAFANPNLAQELVERAEATTLEFSNVRNGAGRLQFLLEQIDI